jgi:hypothetical protein
MIDAEYIVTAIDRQGEREIRKACKTRTEADNYLRTVPREKVPELWRREGKKNANQAQG